MSEQNVLVGRTLTGVKIADDKEALKFETTDGPIVVVAVGDCCSRSWIENVEVTVLSFPAVVTEARDLNLNREPESSDEHECLRFYGFEISTDRGSITIDYRNSSNGYYGGELVWPGDYGNDGDYSKLNWQEVK